MEELVLRDLRAGVLLLTLHRPERHNAWTIDLEETYFGALVDAAADPEVRVIVVTGAGRSFCPGMDMEVLTAAVVGERVSRPRAPMTLPRSIPKPVIAAINGACAGIGFIQACAADLRFASTTAKLATSFARRGLPAESSVSWLLPRLVGTGTALDLLLSGRVLLADEAKSIGLVDRLYEPDELLPATLAYAADLAANCSPRSMAAIKAQVHGDWERTADDSRRRAQQLVVELRDLPDFTEGVESFTQKRPPRFEGLSVDVAVERDSIL